MHEIDCQPKQAEFAGIWRRKPLQIAVLCLSMYAMGSVQAADITIVDVNTGDLNTIVSASQDGNKLLVNENYAERYTVPYDSHDGNAVINEFGGYFDKKITITGWDPNVNITLKFAVANQTQWSWSDYHFEFWNESFTQRLDLNVIDANNDIFSNEKIDAKMVTFWAPAWQQVGQTGNYSLTFAPDLSGLGTQTFGIRQVATVPEPETYAMLLAGLGILGALGRRRKN